jgi:hypothetical protein
MKRCVALIFINVPSRHRYASPQVNTVCQMEQLQGENLQVLHLVAHLVLDKTLARFLSELLEDIRELICTL